MRFPRASGILLHPTSLPGPYGIGDLGPAAFTFVDILVEAKQTWWQTLPVGPTGEGGSPYSSLSAFAGSELLISPEALNADGFIASADEYRVAAEQPERCDLRAAAEAKSAMLDEAFEAFRSGANPHLGDEYAAFIRENAWWLDDFALFIVMRETFDGRPWTVWPSAIRSREADAVARLGEQMSRRIDAVRFRQFIFFRQWSALRKYANRHGIYILGDMPIFVAHDSADVWCNPSEFKLNDDGTARVVAGVPPDHFSKSGQMWGNPIYDWEAMASNRFDWWTARVAAAMRTFDAVRLDHFIGFVRNWEIPGGDETAENGAWADVPGRMLFRTLIERLGELRLIAEDLGDLTPEVELLRDDLEIPGMRVLQFAFGSDANSRDLPHNFSRNTVAYTGTHDNDTSLGWYRSAPSSVRAHCRRYLRASGNQMNWEMLRAVWASVADTAIAPIQDPLGLGSDARMNTPATAAGNWAWRLTDEQLGAFDVVRLAEMTELYGRATRK